MKRSLLLAAVLALAADALPPVLLPNGTRPIRRLDARPRQPQKLTQADLDRIAAAHAKRDRKAAKRRPKS